MPKKHPKFDAAKKAIDALFNDKSVPPEIAREALEDLQADIEADLDALNDDTKAEE